MRRAVGHAVERDLRHAEPPAHRVDVGRDVRGRVERAPVAELAGAGRAPTRSPNPRTPARRRGSARGPTSRSRACRASRRRGRMLRKLSSSAKSRVNGTVAWPGPAGERDDRRAVRPPGAHEADVQRDVPRHLAGPVQRHGDRAALDGVRARRALVGARGRGQRERRRGRRGRVRRGSAEHVRAARGRAGTAMAPSRTCSASGTGRSIRVSVASPHGAWTRSAAAQCTAAAMPERAVERRRQVHLRARRLRERRGREQAGDPAAACDLQAHRVGGAGRDRARLVAGLVHRDAHGHAVAHLAQRARAVDGLLDELEARRAPAPRSSAPPPRRPRRRSRRGAAPSAGPAAARAAATRPASSPTPTLSFTQANPAARGLRARGRGARAVGGVDRRVHRHGVERVVREQLGDRAAGALPGAVPEREVDRRERLGEVAGARQASSTVMPSASSSSAVDRRGVGVQRAAHVVVAHPVVGLQRRGLAAPDRRRRRRTGGRRRACARAARRRTSAAATGTRRVRSATSGS